MAKLSISRIFETSQLLKTKAGQELAGLVNYTAEFAEQALRALRNGITFEDNVSCEIKNVTLFHNIEQIVNTRKTPVGIIVQRVLSASVGVDSLAWWLDDQNRLVVKVGLTGAPTENYDVQLIILQ